MDYKNKTLQLETVIRDLHLTGASDFPLLKELVDRKIKAEKDYFNRINSNLFLYGKSALFFDDIDYTLIVRKKMK